MMRILSIAAALAVIVIVAVALGEFESRTAKPMPLSGFVAPFVFGRFQLPADNPLTQEAFELGRRLFYDPRLSIDNTVSCSTCHLQHLAFTDGRKTGVGVSGKPLAFNSMSLANLMWGPRHFFWDGRAATLEQQALIPIQHPDEMGQGLDELVLKLEQDAEYRQLFADAYGELDVTAIARALATFQRTLVSANSRYDQYLRGEVSLSDAQEQGRKLFMAHPDAKVSLRGANCIDCHSQFLTGGFNTQYDGFTNNGLDDDATLAAGLEAVTGDPAHRGLFKVPTLRNIALTAPYMHDGRFGTLEEVLDHYNEGIKKSSTLSPLIMEANNLGKLSDQRISLNLTQGEKLAIIAFLQTLTDEEFVTTKKFSNPFIAESLQ